MANNNYGDGAFCSFCGKPREQADKLIAGMNDAYICTVVDENLQVVPLGFEVLTVALEDALQAV